mgnify:CR=1 FL=1
MTYCICTNEEKCKFALLTSTLFFCSWRSNAWSSRWANRNRDRDSCKTYNEKEKFRKLFKSPFGQILKPASTLHYPSSLLTYLSPALVSLAQVTSLFSIRLPWKYHVDVLPFIILVMSHSGISKYHFPDNNSGPNREQCLHIHCPFTQQDTSFLKCGCSTD